jgi:hypothetical protein
MYANFVELRACELRRILLPRTPVNKGMKRTGVPHGGTPAAPVVGDALAVLRNPVTLVVLLVLVLDGAPGDAVGAVLLTVLILCGVERLLVDLLGVLGQVVLHTIWQLRDLVVWHPCYSFGSRPRLKRFPLARR